MRTISDIFQNISPELRGAVTPYANKFVRFSFDTIHLADLNPRFISEQDIPAEFIMLSARASNTAPVTFWNSTIVSGLGYPMSAGDGLIIAEDNQAWETAEALARVLGHKNELPRRSIRTTELMVITATPSQFIDVWLGFGPSL